MILGPGRPQARGSLWRDNGDTSLCQIMCIQTYIYIYIHTYIHMYI